MTTRNQLDAEFATRRYTRRHAREIVTAILGNNAGTIVATTDTRWYWVRLHSDPNQVVRAWNAGFVPPVDELPVDIEIIKGNGITDYQIIGVSINKTTVADNFANATGMHALQHQRRDFNTGGFDPLDIYNRALVQMRARAQDTPDLTLYIEPGFYVMLGVVTRWDGGDSAAFAPPAGGYRCDLLYLDSAGALQITTGTVVFVGTPTRPAAPTAGAIPLAYVYLSFATTAITEYDIEDARVLFGASGASSTNALLDGLHHTDTLAGAVLDGDVIIGNVTPKWSRLAISIPAAGILNYLGVNNGELRPSWKSASSNPGAAAAILATDASGYITVVKLTTTTEDIYPNNAGWGLMARMVNRAGIATYDDHFRSGIPAGFAWQGAPFATPDSVTYNYLGDYLNTYSTSGASRAFLSKAITNNAAAWQNKTMRARCRASSQSFSGVRVDDGTDNNYAELYLYANNNGTQTVHYKTRAGGGVASDTATALAIPVTEYLVLMIYIVYSAPNYYSYFEVSAEDGAGILLATTAALAWIPAAGRAGLIHTQAGNYDNAMTDWFADGFG